MNDQLDRFERLVRSMIDETHLYAGLDTRIGDAGLDSLGLLDLVMNIESEFDVVVDLDAFDDRITFRTLASTLLH